MDCSATSDAGEREMPRFANEPRVFTGVGAPRLVKCLCGLAGFRRSLSRAQNHPSVILSERVGAGMGAKDLRTNPGADPGLARRSFAPLGPTHPSLRMTLILDLSIAPGRFFAQVQQPL